MSIIYQPKVGRFGMEGLYLLLPILILIYAIVTFLLPFFVLRIRNELISTNKKLDTLISLAKGDTQISRNQMRGRQTDSQGREIEKCIHCGGNNRAGDLTCAWCGKQLI